MNNGYDGTCTRALRGSPAFKLSNFIPLLLLYYRSLYYERDSNPRSLALMTSEICSKTSFSEKSRSDKDRSIKESKDSYIFPKPKLQPLQLYP